MNCGDDRMHSELPCELGNGLDDSMNAWMIRLIHSYGTVNYQRFQEVGIHPKQLPVMSILRSHSGISQRELAGMLHVKAPTITVTIQRLEKSGLVYREPDSKDQRISRIFLTEKGKNLEDKIKQLAAENEAVLLQGFSTEEEIQLKKLLGRMIENLRSI